MVLNTVSMILSLIALAFALVNLGVMLGSR